MEPLYDDGRSYYLMFELTDVQGDRLCSEPCELEVQPAPPAPEPEYTLVEWREDLGGELELQGVRLRFDYGKSAESQRLIFSVSVDAYISKKHRQIMLIIVALILSLVAQDYLSYLTDNGRRGWGEAIQTGYEKNTSVEDFADQVRKNREKDLVLKATSCGPHKDDLIFEVNGMDIRRFGSQGQQRSAALSLKLAEIGLVKETTGDLPVLLLDDVLSELDTGRQHYLLESIGGIQTFITCTGLEEYQNSPVHIDRVFHVEDGKII